MLKAALFSHPLVLLLFGAAGVLLGLAAPTWTGPAALIVQVSTALLNLLSAPLLIVATLSGLRHLLSLPHPARRLLMIVLAGAALLLCLFFTGFNMLEASQPSLVSRLAPPAHRGAALGVYNTLQSLGFFVGGAGGGWLVKTQGGLGVFVACAALSALWLLIAWPMQAPAVAGPVRH